MAGGGRDGANDIPTSGEQTMSAPFPCDWGGAGRRDLDGQMRLINAGALTKPDFIADDGGGPWRRFHGSGLSSRRRNIREHGEEKFGANNAREHRQIFPVAKKAVR